MVPLEFTASLAFHGQSIDASPEGASHISFAFYLSDRDDITPLSINGGSPLVLATSDNTELDDVSEEVLSGNLTDGGVYASSGITRVEIDADLCATEDRFICIKYVVVADLEPPFRDEDVTNDFQCVDVSSYMACHDGMFIASIFEPQ